MSGTKISKLELAGLRDNGGLAIGQLKSMKITHDLADLRMQFSGFLQWSHAIALVVFAAPYFWFVLYKVFQFHYVEYARRIEGNQIVQSSHLPIPLSETDGVSPLGIQLLKFALSGGETSREWAPSLYATSLFALFLLLNLARLRLLWKTKLLEHEENVTGLPSDFTFSKSPLDSYLYQGMRFGFWIIIFLGVLNTLMFLANEYPN